MENGLTAASFELVPGARNSESASEDGESVSEGTGSEIETPEAEAAAPVTSGRAPTPTPRTRGSQCGVSIDPEGMTPGESLADTLAAASTSHGPDKRYTALGAGEAKRLAEYIPGPPRFSLRGRTRGEERRLTTDAQGLVSLEDKLEIAQAVEEEAMFEEAYMADAGVCIEMPTRKKSGFAAAFNNASRVIAVPLPESVLTFATRRDRGSPRRWVLCACRRGKNPQRPKDRRLEMGAHVQRG